MADTLEQLLKIADRFREDLTQEEQEMIRLIREKGAEQSAPPQTIGQDILEVAKRHGFVRITPTKVILQHGGSYRAVIHHLISHTAYGEGGTYRLFPLKTPSGLLECLGINHKEADEWADKEEGYFIVPLGSATDDEDRAICFFDERTPCPVG